MPGHRGGLNQLEEKLLYPSNTQVAVFASLAAARPSVSTRSRSGWTTRRLPIIFTPSRSSKPEERGCSASIPAISGQRAQPPGLRHRKNRRRRRVPKIGASRSTRM